MVRTFLLCMSLYFLVFFPSPVFPTDVTNKKPRVSLITSVFKGDPFIKGFLEDIVRQSIFPECELILINANSPHNEEPIIKEYAAMYPNIIYVRLNYDPGIYAVWNMGIKLASAELIANANLDDRRNPQSLEVQAQALENDPSIDLVYGDYLLTYGAHETFEKNTHSRIVKNPDFAPHLMHICLPGPQPMWRKSMHDKYGFFDESFFSAGDYEMWLRAVSKGGVFKKIPQLITGLYYHNPQGLSTDTQDVAKTRRRKAEDKQIAQRYSYLWQSKSRTKYTAPRENPYVRAVAAYV